MQPWHWFLIVVSAFIGYFILAGILQKDNKGATLIVVAIFLIALLLISVSGCTVSRDYQPWLEAGVAFDTQKSVGRNPACIVRLRQPVGFGPLEPDWLQVGYTHHSSCPDLYDKTTVDQLEVVAKIPLGRRR